MTCMNRETELALVVRLRAGDASAFDAVHHSFNRPLFNFLARLSRRRDVAEDLLEETWLRLVARAHTLRGDTRLGPWLFTVARNLYLSYCRSRFLEDLRATCGIDGRNLESSAPSPFDTTLATETAQRIDDVLASLPLIYREVLLLVGVEGFSPGEAAEVCGITPEAMRQRLSRARALLAQRLDERDRPRRAVFREAKI
jgi:RNA polymerase sigma-70 factor (ECF subfamily)